MAMKLSLVLGLFLCLLCWNTNASSAEEDDTATTTSRPNIIFMFADDWGFNDAGWHSNTNTQMDFLTKLANEESIMLRHNYVSALCTISRAAFLTGRYPFRYGMQHFVLKPQSRYALTTQESLISNEFQNAGYSTHMVGKWHLGMLAKEYTPTYRGFDTFHGYYLGKSHYYTHIYDLSIDAQDVYLSFKDLRVNEDIAGDTYDGDYGPFWQRDRVLEILSTMKEDENKDKPFFLYVAWQASHSPSESPSELFDLYNTENKLTEDDLSDDTNNWVRRYNMQAQTTALDQSMQDVVTYLKENNLWDNTIIVFSSDNGGESDYGDNAPLRGAKNTYFEGGIRVPAFVTGGQIPESKKGSYFDEISHVCDWYPTLMSFAGLDSSESDLVANSLDTQLDGVNLHSKLFGLETDNDDDKEEEQEENDDESSLNSEMEEIQSLIKNKNVREIVHQVDKYECDYTICGAIRYGNYKYLIGGAYFNWNDDSLLTSFWDRRYTIDSKSESGIVECGEAPTTVYDLGYESDDDYLNSNDFDESVATFSNNCASELGCLFDIENDPCEYNDLSETKSHIAAFLKEKLLKYQEEAATPLAQSAGTYTMTSYSQDDETNWPPMVDENGYWSPFIDISELENGELDFETGLRNEKEAKLSSKGFVGIDKRGGMPGRDEKLLAEETKSFLGASTNSGLMSISRDAVLGVVYAFLVILTISSVFVGLIIYQKRKEYNERKMRRGSELLKRFKVGMDEVEE